jgi:hypothetical protein
VAARSKAWVFGHSLLELDVRNPPRARMSVFCELCMLSRRGLCIGLITHSEQSYRMCVVSECDREG